MIEEYIPKGFDNRVSRGYLAETLHIPDRAVRRRIEEARARGVLIASYEGGYFRYKNKKDRPYIAAYIRQEVKRFKTQSHQNKMLKMAWDKIDTCGQMSLF